MFNMNQYPFKLRVNSCRVQTERLPEIRTKFRLSISRKWASSRPLVFEDLNLQKKADNGVGSSVKYPENQISLLLILIAMIDQSMPVNSMKCTPITSCFGL